MYNFRCTNIGTETRRGRAGQLYTCRHRGGFQRRGGYWSPSFGTLFFPYSFRVFEKNMAVGDILCIRHPPLNLHPQKEVPYNYDTP